MGQVIVIENVTLDGVMQAPGRADEDTRDGFTHGGWAVPFNMGEGMDHSGDRPSALLFGRRTYEDFAGFWPHQTDGNPFTGVLDMMQKYVVSTTLHDPLPWQNSTVVPKIDAVAALREETDLVVLGCGELVASLLERGLVDQLVLRIHPLVLGSGRRLFPTGLHTSFAHSDTLTTSTGVVVATYRKETTS